jgi:hypothetical protein
LRDGVAAGDQFQLTVSEMRSGAALLQAMRALRTVDAVSVFEADPGAHSGEGSVKRVHPILSASDGGTRLGIADAAGQDRPTGGQRAATA